MMERNQLHEDQAQKIHAKFEEISNPVAYQASGVEKEVIILICSQMNDSISR